MKHWAAFILLGMLLATAGGAGDALPSSVCGVRVLAHRMFGLGTNGGRVRPPYRRENRPASASSQVTFVAMDVDIDPHGKPLACYQVKVIATAGQAALVGIEGGESAAFSNAPFYDPRALQGNRIIIGAYSLANDLPTGKTRVARLMFQVTGDVRPEYQATLQVAASNDGQPIPATVSVELAGCAAGNGEAK